MFVAVTAALRLVSLCRSSIPPNFNPQEVILAMRSFVRNNWFHATFESAWAIQASICAGAILSAQAHRHDESTKLAA